MVMDLTELVQIIWTSMTSGKKVNVVITVEHNNKP